MKKRLSSRALFALASILLAAANIVLLAGVAANRSGSPESLTILSERELQLPYRLHKEDSGLALRLVWRSLDRDPDEPADQSGWQSPAWFTAKKLEALGFKGADLLRQSDDDHHFQEPLPREVFLVLELDGPAFQENLRRAENKRAREQRLLSVDRADKTLQANYDRASKRLKSEGLSRSRLFVIDAGLDRIKLRARYPDRGRFILVKGLVRAGYRGKREKRELFGIISALSTPRIQVTRKQRAALDSLLAREPNGREELQPPRYTVRLAYGNRLEPWIVEVQLIEPEGDSIGKKQAQLR
ncbi:DUF4824 family protein [Desulfogranum mediterraneum]|uniref:DUF4824 family protein n=1 Tax=Desulfogranum mediterraneum TaxID=160661 RepID=UPI0003FB0FC3|nr:DUF4824 family protein [Desulfogranum mediterraneum]